jgi:hypothetical protein
VRATPDQKADLIAHWQQNPVDFCKDVLGVAPWWKQVRILESVRDNKRTCVRSGHNIGKALATDTPIPTPAGFCSIGDLKAGDVVFDERGDQTSVVAVKRWENRPCFRVIFDDGTSIVADENHDWYTVSANERRNAARGSRDPLGRLHTTLEMSTSLVTEHRGRDHAIPLAWALRLPRENLPIDPYVLGAWLGDGTSTRPDITNPDPEVWDEIERRGYGTVDIPSQSKNGRCETRRVVMPDGSRMIDALRGLGIVSNKHVPALYLRAGYEQRMALLTGLLDTDGHCMETGIVEFCSKDLALARAVLELARSLSMKPGMSISRATLYGKDCGPRHRVWFTPHVPVFLIKRKRERQIRSNQKSRQRMVVAVEPEERQETVCIQVSSPTHMFLAGEAMIPTHNSWISACTVIWYMCCFPRARVVTTATNFNQVQNVLWGEIRRIHANALWPLGGNMYRIPKWVAGEGHSAIGISSDKPDSLQGIHSPHVLIVIDEAQGIDERSIFDALESMMGGDGCRMLAIGNPLYSHGEFRNMFRDERFHKIHVSCLDHPNVKFKKEIIAGAVSHEHIETLKEDPMRGPGTLEWDTRIIGEFPKFGGDELVPEEWLEASSKIPPDKKLLNDHHIGLDCAEFGGDLNVCVVVCEGRLEYMESWGYTKVEESVAKVQVIAAQYGVRGENIHYDVSGGVGASFRRIFEIQGIPADPVAFGGPPVNDWAVLFGKEVKHQFLNRRAEMFWTMRALFERGCIRVPPKYVTTFRFEFGGIKFGFFESGKLFIWAKKRIRALLGRSPDHADALCIAFSRQSELSKVSTFIPSFKPQDPREKYDPNNKFSPKKGRRNRGSF